LLSALLHDEGRAALGTRFVNRLVRRGEIAIRIAAAAIENAAGAAAARNSAPYKFTFIAFRALDSQRDGSRVFALWIIRATDEIAEAARPAQELRIVQRAFFIERNIRLARDACAFHQSSRGFTIGITFAREKHAEAPALNHHFLAAIVAVLDLGLAIRFRGKLGRQVLDVIAIRVTVAAQEKSMPADAPRAILPSPHFSHFAPVGMPALYESISPSALSRSTTKRSQNSFTAVRQGSLPSSIFVQFLFQARREAHVENILEALHQ